MVSDDTSRNPWWRLLVNDLAALAIIALCGTLIWSTLASRQGAAAPPARGGPPARPAFSLPADPVSLGTPATLGRIDAPVVLIEYSDFQCPFCARFATESLPVLKTEYVDTGRVLFAYRHFPLATIHPHAQQAAEAAECAGAQGRFWNLHDALFANQQRLDEASLLEHAASAGLDPDAFRTCLDGDMRDKVQRDATDAAALGISGTPAFLIGLRQPDGKVKIGRVLSGARPVKDFILALDRVLEAVETR